MFWSLKETNRLRTARRILGGLSVLIGCFNIATQSGAIFFGVFGEARPRELAVGILLVIMGVCMLLSKPCEDSR
ncbi:MAG TPA: hypothetical protein PK468_11060 [Candidatus Hydrogenedentes bacterium]|nr:hypothetical protein [Candidatus Hydrogenedentota bacterium]